MSCVTQDIHWVGTEKEKRAFNKEELKVLLSKDVSSYPKPYKIKIESIDKQKITDSVIQIWVTAHQIEGPDDVCGVTVQCMLTCVNSSEGWLVSGVHISVPNSEQEKYSLKHELDETRSKEKLLMNSIPGGTAIYRIKKSGKVIAEYLSEGLPKMCGYDNAADCMNMLKDGVDNGIPKEDFKRIYNSIYQCIMHGEPIEETYSIYTKNREPVTVTMYANVLTGDELAEDDLAVLFAVHILVPDEKRTLELERYRYRLLLDMMGIAYWEWNGADQTFSSEKHKEYAISDADLSEISKPELLFKYFHPDDIQIAKGIIKIGEIGEKKRQATLRAKMKDGTYRWTEMITLIDIGNDKVPKRIINVLRDVNEEWLRQREHIEKDSLTSIYNRHYIEGVLPRYIEEAIEVNGNVVVALVDVDDFKSLNDSFGHIAGDEALKKIAATLSCHFSVAKDDFVARFGGDEFLIVCRNMSKMVFVERLEECISAISKLTFENYDEMHVEISAGCVVTDEIEELTVNRLLIEADKKLYNAKDEGKGKLKY